MRDGTRLATDVYLPTSGGPWPAVLTRTPYDKSTDEPSVDPDWISLLHASGYAYVVQDTRGRFASEGSDSTFWTDGWGANQDGYDTIDWIASRSWCNGRVGMYGESARGIVQYLAAGATPDALDACVSLIACDDFYDKAFFQGGAYREELVDGWFGGQDAEEMLPFFHAHPTRDPFWDALDLHTRASLVDVPILHIGGHHDIFGESAIDAFRVLEESGGPGAAGHQKLVLGPWTHYGIETRVQGELVFPPNAVLVPDTLAIRWFDRWLKDIPNGIDLEPAVRYYEMGDVDDGGAPGNEWRSADSFPPAGTRDVALYVHGVTSATPYSLQWTPPSGEDAIYYTNDPTDPFPVRGGRNLYLDAGPFDQRPTYVGRNDGVAVNTPPLPAPVTIVGKVRFRFWAETSVLDTDWCVKLTDIHPDGRAMLVTDGVLRARFRNGFETEELLSPWTLTEYEVDLWSTAMTFAAGHRIGITLTNSNAPRFAVNPQSGSPFGTPFDPVSGVVGLFTDESHPSHLILPVYDGGILDVVEAMLPAPPVTLRVTRSPARTVTATLGGPEAGRARVSVYAVGGRRVRMLDPVREGGGWVVRWDGRDGHGRQLPAGVYHLAPSGGRDAVGVVLLP